MLLWASALLGLQALSVGHLDHRSNQNPLRAELNAASLVTGVNTARADRRSGKQIEENPNGT
jgi:hypothetical protein